MHRFWPYLRLARAPRFVLIWNGVGENIHNALGGEAVGGIEVCWMRSTAVALIALLMVTTIAGCITGQQGSEDGPDELAPTLDEMGRTITSIDLEGAAVVVSAAMGAISTLQVDEGNVIFALPSNVWRVHDNRIDWNGVPVGGLKAGESVDFLVPTAAESLPVALRSIVEGQPTPEVDAAKGGARPSAQTDLAGLVGGTSADVFVVPTPWHAEASFVNGQHVIDLMEIQRDEYPYRVPGQPNYERAQDYFVEYLTDLGYEIVVKDEYSMNDVSELPTSPNTQPLANVYAYRPGTGLVDTIVGFGGHYDMVPGTRDAAFDDTSGTLMTLAMAKAFANIETDVGLLFGLWGGEESGLLGSNFFVKSHPHIVAQMALYINFDVAALSWPGPALHADPIIISPGPDGIIAQSLETQARNVIATYMPEIPEESQIYEPIVEGQARGQGGVNAQSDHTSFMAQGVPVYFPFTGNVSTVFALFHSPRDTLQNLTAYMATQLPIAGDDQEPLLTPEEEALGRMLLARSMETFMGFALYQALEINQGLYAPPGKGLT